MDEKIVLVLLDGSSRGEEALPPALLRTRESGARLRLLQVVSPPLPFWPDTRERERAAWLYLDTIRESLREQGVQVECQVRRGSPIPTLLRVATNAQTVLLSTWNGAILGTLVGNPLIARMAACPRCNVERVRAARDRLESKRQRVRSFEEDRCGRGVLAQRPVGLRSVPVHQIVGSVGRAHELNGQFLITPNTVTPGIAVSMRRWAVARSFRQWSYTSSAIGTTRSTGTTASRQRERSA